MRISYVGENISKIKKEDAQDLVSYEFTPEQIKDFKHIFKFLNSKDRDILYLIFVSKLKQNYVQKILNRSQPSLCYDIKRIKKRLKFIYYIYSVIDVFKNFIEISKYSDEENEILACMFYTTSLTHTAKILCQQQIKIRYKFDKIIKKLEDDENWEIYEIFSYIRENLNIIKRFYKE